MFAPVPSENQMRHEPLFRCAYDGYSVFAKFHLKLKSIISLCNGATTVVCTLCFLSRNRTVFHIFVGREWRERFSLHKCRALHQQYSSGEPHRLLSEKGT